MIVLGEISKAEVLNSYSLTKILCFKGIRAVESSLAGELWKYCDIENPNPIKQRSTGTNTSVIKPL